MAIRSRSDSKMMILLDELLNSVGQESAEVVLSCIRDRSMSLLKHSLTRASSSQFQMANARIDWFGLSPTECHQSRETVNALLERAGIVIAMLPLNSSARHMARSIVPGEYCLRLDTGRVLWRSTLQRQQLLTRLANDSVYRAAASSETRGEKKRELLFNSERAEELPGEDPGAPCCCIQLSLFRGFDSGSIEMQVSQMRGAGS